MEPLLIEQYVAPGTISFEYRDFAFLHENSVEAAEAARCANDQGKFWEYHHYLFYNGDNPTLEGLTRPTFELIAEHLELDMEAFRACLDADTYEEEVIAEYEQAKALGIPGTPALLIDGELVTGIETYGDLFDLIDAAAAE